MNRQTRTALGYGALIVALILLCWLPYCLFERLRVAIVLGLAICALTGTSFYLLATEGDGNV